MTTVDAVFALAGGLFTGFTLTCAILAYCRWGDRQHTKEIGDSFETGYDLACTQCGCATCMRMHMLFAEHGSSHAALAAMRWERTRP
jgi:hypothetical protein